MATIIYCRISSDTKDAAGVERQERECRELCEQWGWVDVEVLVDNDISATTGAVRPQFERLLQMNDVDRVVTWVTDRLIRVTKDLERVIEKQWLVFSVKASDLDLETPSGRAVARTITAWSTYEGELKAERIRSAHRQRVERGKPFWGSVRPLGYNRDGSIHPDEAEAVRGAYRDACAGATPADIGRGWEGLGLKGTRGGDKWPSTAVCAVLKHPRYKGKMTRANSLEEVGDGSWEPLVSEEDWTLAGTMIANLSARGLSRSRTGNLLVGIATCGKCGQPARTDRHPHTKEPTYVTKCKHCMAHLAEADAHVERELLKFLSSPLAHIHLESKIDADTVEVASDLRKVNDRLEELALDYAEGVITRAQLHKATANLKGKAEALGRVLEQSVHPNPLGPYKTLTQLVNALRTAPRTVRKGIVEEWVEVTLWPTGRGRTWRPERGIQVRVK